jgi:hypothetical protein
MKQTAPQLFHNKKDPQKGEAFVFYPQDLLQAINNLCTYNEQRLLLTLLGCKGDGSFSPSIDYILKMSGITKSNHYYVARKDLEKKGYLKVEDGAIYIEPDKIISDHQKGERKKRKQSPKT